MSRRHKVKKRKAERRLLARQKAHDKHVSESRDGGKGYTKPGSMKK